MLAKVRRECPQAGANSPQDTNSTHMSYEVIGAIVIAAYKIDVPAALAYVRTVTALHWSSGALSKEAHEHAAKLRTVAGLAPPNLCADVRAWAPAGSARCPRARSSSTRSSNRRGSRSACIPKGSARYESASAKALARRSRQVEEQLIEGEARVTESSYETIMDALELWP